MIAVVDYGVANLGSILNMLRKLGARAEAVSTPAAIEQADKIILPGVGAFDYGMSALAERRLVEPLKKRVRVEGVPILGICLGMQLLGKGSEEGVLGGLSLVDGCCVCFRFEGERQLKVPHMGWNELASMRDSPLFNGLDAHARFYFVHSYHMVCADPADVLATARYGIEFTAMVQRGNVWGAQFHPEKSHRFGMTLLSNFARI
jgi:glutamine amidotransferase